MTRLIWTPETLDLGVDQGVLYPADGYGEVWNGLVTVQESPSDGSDVVVHVDGIKTRHQRRVSDFSMSAEAFSFPEWILRARYPFGFSYRNGSKIHLVYNVRAKLKDRTYEQNETAPFSLDISAKPLPIPEARASAQLVVDTNTVYPEVLAELEDLLYGSDLNVPQLPLPEDIFALFESHSILTVIDYGDGSFTVTGPDDAIQVENEEFTISWPSAVYLDYESYKIQSH